MTIDQLGILIIAWEAIQGIAYGSFFYWLTLRKVKSIPIIGGFVK